MFSEKEIAFYRGLDIYSRSEALVNRFFKSKIDKSSHDYREHLRHVSEDFTNKKVKSLALLHDILEDTEAVLNKANQAIQTLEKYRKVYDNKLGILNEYEFNDIVTLDNVLTVIQRAEMVMKIVEEIKKQIYELGNDGRLVNMQLEELIGGLAKEELLLVKDYQVNDTMAEEILEQLSNLNHEDLRKEPIIAKILGYESFENFEELAVYPKGYRILSKVPRMPNTIVENLVKSFKSFQHILVAEISDLDKVDGIGEIRAKTIKQTLKKMQEQFAFDNILI